MIVQPSYEHGQQWYGLGLDVQDNGKTWGHTGAMEGTSTTVCHHKSGLTWALLFNTWAKDMDLDGLVKYGLSKISCLPMWTGITSANKYVIDSKTQKIHLLMSLDEVQSCINSGLVLTCANMTYYAGCLCVNAIWQIKTNNTFIHIGKNTCNIEQLICDSNLSNAYVYLLETFYFKDVMYYIISMTESPVKIQQHIYVNVEDEES